MIEGELNKLVDPSLTESEKDEFVTKAVSKLSDLCVRIARRHARYPGLVWSRDGDDLVQLVQEVALMKLKRIARDSAMMSANFEVQLSTSARGAIRDYADSGQNTMMARGGAASRRARVEFVRRERDALLDQSPSPTSPQFVTVVFDNEAESASPGDASGHLEMQSTIERTISECARHESPAVLDVAREMFSWFPNGEPPTVADIAQNLNIPYTTTKRRYEEVASVFQRINGGRSE